MATQVKFYKGMTSDLARQSNVGSPNKTAETGGVMFSKDGRIFTKEDSGNTDVIEYYKDDLNFTTDSDSMVATKGVLSGIDLKDMSLKDVLKKMFFGTYYPKLMLKHSISGSVTFKVYKQTGENAYSDSAESGTTIYSLPSLKYKITSELSVTPKTAIIRAYKDGNESNTSVNNLFEAKGGGAEKFSITEGELKQNDITNTNYSNSQIKAASETAGSKITYTPYKKVSATFSEGTEEVKDSTGTKTQYYSTSKANEEELDKTISTLVNNKYHIKEQIESSPITTSVTINTYLPIFYSYGISDVQAFSSISTTSDGKVNTPKYRDELSHSNSKTLNSTTNIHIESIQYLGYKVVDGQALDGLNSFIVESNNKSALGVIFPEKEAGVTISFLIPSNLKISAWYGYSNTSGKYEKLPSKWIIDSEYKPLKKIESGETTYVKDSNYYLAKCPNTGKVDSNAYIIEFEKS